MSSPTLVRSSLPIVFVFSAKHIGGCDTKRNYTNLSAHLMEIHRSLSKQFGLVVSVFAGVMENNKQGKLVPLLTEAGAIANNSSQL
ncbi:hypothetical protein Bca52824_007113 [Brassica carinata]|uniref:Uncharacterized protein n=1 Tax=Brassica carinata TaxID=52824 RepID=A0A8X8B6P1_BRACI|nr:hypothetical protein Bca52824_007113 [Brassica carinata]